MHDITASLERLPERIEEGQSVDFFIVSKHKAVNGGAVNGFGIVIERADKGSAKPISGSSDTTESTQFRGLLSAVLTSLEWSSLNCRTTSIKRIHSSSDAIYHHLPKQIKKWIADTSHVNHPLLVKIDASLGSAPNVSFVRVTVDDPRYRAAKKLADAAAARRASQARTRKDEAEEEPEFDLYEFDEMAFQNALAKDP